MFEGDDQGNDVGQGDYRGFALRGPASAQIVHEAWVVAEDPPYLRVRDRVDLLQSVYTAKEEEPSNLSSGFLAASFRHGGRMA